MQRRRLIPVLDLDARNLGLQVSSFCTVIAPLIFQDQLVSCFEDVLLPFRHPCYRSVEYSTRQSLTEDVTYWQQ